MNLIDVCSWVTRVTQHSLSWLIGETDSGTDSDSNPILVLGSYGLFTLPDSDSDLDSDLDSCTIQKFHIGSDPDSDALIEMYGIGMDICPRDRYLSLKWVQ